MTTDSLSESVSVPDRPGFDFTSDPALLAAHRDEWNRLREECPAFRVPGDEHDVWWLLRYDDIRTMAQDWQLFSSDFVHADTGIHTIPENLDPPEHTKFRRLLTAELGPTPVRERENRVRARCVELIEGIRGQGHCDFRSDFALKFPTAIFMEIMGLPLERGDEFIERAQVLLHTSNADDPGFKVRGRAGNEISDDLKELVASRRLEPKDDLMSELLNAKIGDRPITDDELIRMSFLLYLAGLDTVASVMSYSFKYLAEHPELRHTLVDSPELVGPAVEEFLRYFGIATLQRVVTHDAEFAGCPMKKGDVVMSPMASAGRDPRQFPKPDEFELDRAPNRHLAFGDGPHRCVGLHLGRLELRIALEEWHRRIPDYRLADDALITEHVGVLAGLSGVPLVWD